MAHAPCCVFGCLLIISRLVDQPNNVLIFRGWLPCMVNKEAVCFFWQNQWNQPLFLCIYKWTLNNIFAFIIRGKSSLYKIFYCSCSDSFPVSASICSCSDSKWAGKTWGKTIEQKTTSQILPAVLHPSKADCMLSCPWTEHKVHTL